MSASNPPHNIGPGMDIVLDSIEKYYAHTRDLLSIFKQTYVCPKRLETQLEQVDYHCNLLSYYIQQSCVQLDSIEQYSLNTCEIDVVADEFSNPTSSTLPLKIEPMMSTHKYHNQDVHLPISSHDATLTGLDKLQRTEDNYVREDLLNNIMHDFLLASIDGNDIDSDFSAEDTDDNEDIQVVGVVSNISSGDTSQLQITSLQQDDTAPPPTPLGNPDHIHLPYQQDAANLTTGGVSNYEQNSVNPTLGDYVDSSHLGLSSALSKNEADGTDMTSHTQYYQSAQMQNIIPKNTPHQQYNETSNDQAYQESLSYSSYGHMSSSHQQAYPTNQYYPLHGSGELPQPQLIDQSSMTSSNYMPEQNYSSSQSQYSYNGSYTQQGQ